VKLIEWVEVNAVIAAAFPEAKQPDENALAVVHRMFMANWPQRVILDAFQAYVDDGHTFAPNVSQLIAKAKEMTGPTHDFDAAWMEALSHVRNCGYMRKPEWNDPIMERIMHSYGWQRFCEQEEDQLGYVRNHLKGAYDAERRHRELVAFRLQRGDIMEITDGAR
jgi:hypothetical protein